MQSTSRTIGKETESLEFSLVSFASLFAFSLLSAHALPFGFALDFDHPLNNCVGLGRIIECLLLRFTRLLRGAFSSRFHSFSCDT